MSKKTGTIIKIVAFVAGIAAVGAACYVYRDKIKEFFEKHDVKGKIDNAKNFITDKFSKNNNEDYFDDAEFFDDDALVDEDTSNRGYTSITIAAEDEDDAEDAKQSVEIKIEATEEEVEEVEETPETVAEEEKEEVAEDVTEEAPAEFEYEGLSDVSEDEDVLADEAALDGADF